MFAKILLSAVPVLVLGTAVWAVPQKDSKTVPVSGVKMVKESDSETAAGKKGGGMKKGRSYKEHREERGNRSYREHREYKEYRGYREHREHREYREHRERDERGWFDFRGFRDGDYDDDDC